MVDQAVIIAAGKGSRLNGCGGGRPKPLVKVAGVELLKRTLLSAQRAGIDRFVVVIGYRGDEIREAISSDPQIDVEIEWAENADWERGNGLSVLQARDYVDGPFVLMMADHLFDPQALTKLRHFSLGADEAALCVDQDLEAIPDMDDATKVWLDGEHIVQIGKEIASYNGVDTGLFLCNASIFRALDQAVQAGDESLSGGVRALAEDGNMRAVDMDGLFWQDVDTPEALRCAESALFAGLGKPTDGFVSRHLNRKISGRISRLLVRTPVTPNQISVATMLISFLATWFIASGDYLLLAVGGLLFQFASIVDGCDGEVAKLKFMNSRAGEWLDTLADNVSYLVYFVGVSYGAYRLAGESYILTLGWTALVLDILSISLITLYLRHIGSGSIVSFNMAFSDEVPVEQQGRFHRFCCAVKFCVRRDFFAAVFCGLALLGRLDAIYWMFIAGSAGFCAAVFAYAGYMLRTRGAWPETTRVEVEGEKLLSGKAD